MEEIVLFILHVIFFIGTVITTLYVSAYSPVIATLFVILYIIAVFNLAKETN